MDFFFVKCLQNSTKLRKFANYFTVDNVQLSYPRQIKLPHKFFQEPNNFKNICAHILNRHFMFKFLRNWLFTQKIMILIIFLKFRCNIFVGI